MLNNTKILLTSLRYLFLVFLLVAGLVTITASGGGDSDDDSSSSTESTTDDTTDNSYDFSDLPTGTTFSATTYNVSATITLSGTSIAVSGTGADAVNISGTTAILTSPGTYDISGTLNNGQLIVNTADSGDIRLIFDDMHITCSTGAPIDIESAERVIIVLADGADNSLTDTHSSSVLDEDGEDIDAALYSKEDLVIYSNGNGTGSLTVDTDYKDGIKSKDGLIIVNGTIIVNSADDGIIGKNYISVEDGDITIDAGGDGMKSTNDGDEEQGYIYIYDGFFDITAGTSGSGDAVQVETYLVIEGGTFDKLVTAGGSGNNASLGEEDTAKGLKAPVGIVISGGIFAIDTSDDAIHSNDTIIITDGVFDLASGDDAIHADNELTIAGDTTDIDISTCYEGIEGKVITINDGDIHVLSDDDPINGSGDGGGISVNINSGLMYFECDNADGFDSNGAIVITGGTVIINGPEGGANGILDYASFSMTGGFLIGAGTSSMAMPAGNSNSQGSLMIYFSSKQDAGTLLHIETSDGDTEIVTFEPSVDYRAIEISSSLLTIGAEYDIYLGGTYDAGTDTYGLGGTYNNDGTLYRNFTFDSTSTTVGTAGGGSR